MQTLNLESVAYGYKKHFGVANITFALEPGMIGALVGASGSGKTTILKLIAGFLTPERGTIRMNGEVIAAAGNALAPHKRGIGLVFQQHALLPHLTVRQNILFACPDRRGTCNSRLEQLLADFRITQLSHRFPHQISGGEAQRVALARALAADPKLLLMDEAFSSIDSVLRREIRQECMAVLRSLGVTTLLVTHDAEEAMELAQRIIVLEAGQVAQVGGPHEVYYHPATVGVAGLFGEINRLSDRDWIRRLTGQEVEHLLIRPEAFDISVDNEGDGPQGVITQLYYRGNYEILTVQLEGGPTLKVHTHHHHFVKCQRVRVQLATPK